MDTLQAIRERHSVRAYTEQKIEEDKRAVLEKLVNEINAESGLHMQIHFDDPEGFDSRLAHYGRFENVNNYIVLAGKKDEDIEEKCGYYGEKLVLEAQKLGLNTCWVASTFNKSVVKKLLPPEEKLCVVISLGYGQTQGVQHKGKSLEHVVASKGNMPDWFRAGAEAALLAPTAINQQKFKMGIKDGEPVIKVSGIGVLTKVDLGIVKYHFEVASGRKVQ
ncbi:MAG: nitroreductase [Lachnospiraceae bacterium]|nr:nitroreductase [Lachnospiraceae bacterium]